MGIVVILVGAISAAGLATLVVMALMGFRSGGNTAGAATYRDAPHTRAPQRSRPSKRERRAPSLPPDATVTFAAERQDAGIDEVLDALDADMIGLVPVKKKVQEV